MKASPASAVASRSSQSATAPTGKTTSAKASSIGPAAGKIANGKPAVVRHAGKSATVAVSPPAETKKPVIPKPSPQTVKQPVATARAEAQSSRAKTAAAHPIPEARTPEANISDTATPAVKSAIKPVSRPGFSETPQAAAPMPTPAGAPVMARPAAPPPTTEQGPRHMAQPPRAMAKAETFVEGDHVVYPTHGVGKVERIAIEDIAGHRLELIHITFEENRMTLRVPVAKARTAGLRKLATRKMFDEALGVLRGRARVKRTMWSRRAQEYEAKINSGDPLAIAEVVRDLHRNAGQPDQSFSERQIYEQAMDRLAAELAALDQTDKLTAATKLSEFLKTV